MYIADSGNRRVRRVAPDGRISTFAGNGEENCPDNEESAYDSWFGDGGPAVDAVIKRPVDVAVENDGAVLIADSENMTHRR